MNIKLLNDYMIFMIYIQNFKQHILLCYNYHSKIQNKKT